MLYLSNPVRKVSCMRNSWHEKLMHEKRVFLKMKILPPRFSWVTIQFTHHIC